MKGPVKSDVRRAFVFRRGITALLLVLAGACGHIEQSYRPARLGSLADPVPARGLLMTLSPDRPAARFGDQVSFHVTITNQGSGPVWLPQQPEVLLTWIYPDGKCDNFVSDPEPQAAPSKLTPLPPGAQRQHIARVDTFYFSREGITEFRSRLPLPSPPGSDNGAACGDELISNGFGILFAK